LPMCSFDTPNGRWEMKLRFALTDTALRSAKPRAESYKMWCCPVMFRHARRMSATAVDV